MGWFFCLRSQIQARFWSTSFVDWKYFSTSSVNAGHVLGPVPLNRAFRWPCAKSSAVPLTMCRVTQLICSSGHVSLKLVKQIVLCKSGFLFWILYFFLGTSSDTCSSSLSLFTITSGWSDQPSLVMVHKYLISGSLAWSDDPCAMAEDAKGTEYMSSPVLELRSFGLMEGAVWVRDSCVIGESNEVLGSPDLNVTAMVRRGSIKKPSESLGNMYELGLNSLYSNKRNLVAGKGASTPTSTGAGGRLPTGACSCLTGSRPLWIVGRAVPPAVTTAI